MGRAPVIAVERKTRVVLAVLAGEVSVSEAARKEKVSEQSIHRWRADFVECGKVGLSAGRTGLSTPRAAARSGGRRADAGAGRGAPGGAGLEEVS